MENTQANRLYAEFLNRLLKKEKMKQYIHFTLPAALGPGVYSASNRNEYQKHKNNVSGE
jgi:hypothetical protein